MEWPGGRPLLWVGRTRRCRHAVAAPLLVLLRDVRLRALAGELEARGDRLIAYETAGAERLYPWQTGRGAEPFEWVTLYPDRALESLPHAACT